MTFLSGILCPYLPWKGPGHERPIPHGGYRSGLCPAPGTGATKCAWQGMRQFKWPFLSLRWWPMVFSGTDEATCVWPGAGAQKPISPSLQGKSPSVRCTRGSLLHDSCGGAAAGGAELQLFCLPGCGPFGFGAGVLKHSAWTSRWARMNHWKSSSCAHWVISMSSVTGSSLPVFSMAWRWLEITRCRPGPVPPSAPQPGPGQWSSRPSHGP